MRSKPIWCYCIQSNTHKWGNDEALTLWECNTAESFKSKDVANIYPPLHKPVEGSLLKLELALYHKAIEVKLLHVAGNEMVMELVEEHNLPSIQQGKPSPEEKEELLIFNNATVGILYVKDRVMYKFNPRFVEIFGYSFVEYLNKSSRMLYRNEAEYLSLHEQSFSILKDGGVARLERKMRRKSGEVFWVSTTGKLIDPDEPNGGSIWIIEDIDKQKKAQQELEDVLIQQKAILDHAMVGIVFLKNRRVTQCNKRFEEIFGYKLNELKEASSRLWYLSDEDWLAAAAQCYEPLRLGKTFTGEMLLGKKGGIPVWCEVQSRAVDPSNLDKGTIWVTMDIHEKKLAQQELTQLLADKQLILDHASVGIVHVVDRKMTQCNQAFSEMFGYSAKELEGHSSRLLHQSDEEWGSNGKKCFHALRQGLAYGDVIRLRRKDGSEVWCDMRGKAYDPDNIDRGVIWITLDVTERRLAEEKIRYLATHDVLTNLPNRSLFEEKAALALRHANRVGDKVGLIFIDVDHFKNINDSLGHDHGDTILCEVGRRLSKSIRETDTAARFGGDEFVMLLTHLIDSNELETIIHKVRQQFNSPIISGSHSFQVTLSIGAAIYPNDASGLVDLMKMADIAMYECKHSGRNAFKIYNAKGLTA